MRLLGGNSKNSCMNYDLFWLQSFNILMRRGILDVITKNGSFQNVCDHIHFSNINTVRPCKLAAISREVQT